ncbi:hypothetical protein P3339_05620 [Microbulbifer sp. MLAF003]|uniref:hypothetical protein n=1 Tax=Microbulbifer sp. MLAF003 TaxID=3032582 RepID=UPI0024ACE4A0|nr:hypothetical protein [Microbulbifer sp. MLAF003]WHI52265.1 hypothetical protein P3339_05620 [Microbulbifer sp. MLAF003]
MGFEVFVSESLRAGMIFSSFGNIRFFNQVQVFIIPLLLIFASRTKFYSLAYLFLFANFLLAFASGARGLLLSIIVTGLLSFVFLKPWRRQILYGLIVCAFAYMAYFLILEWLGNVGHIFRTSTSGRLAIWWELLSKLSTLNIFFGNGVGAYTFQTLFIFLGIPIIAFCSFYMNGGLLLRFRRWLPYFGCVGLLISSLRVMAIVQKKIFRPPYFMPCVRHLFIPFSVGFL